MGTAVRTDWGAELLPGAGTLEESGDRETGAGVGAVTAATMSG